MKLLSMAAFFTAQLGIGYYCIFHVPWLGWDLVEPMTYTVGQGCFVVGLCIILRRRGLNFEYSDLRTYWKDAFFKKYAARHGFDIHKYEVLRENLAQL